MAIRIFIDGEYEMSDVIIIYAVLVYPITYAVILPIGVSSLNYYRVLNNLSEDDVKIYIDKLRFFRDTLAQVYTNKALYQMLVERSTDLNQLKRSKLVNTFFALLLLFNVITVAIPRANGVALIYLLIWIIIFILLLIKSWHFGRELSNLHNKETPIDSHE